jgi:hypothetical protein
MVMSPSDDCRGAGEFTQKAYSLGAEQNFPWDKALAVADSIDDEELIRKLDLKHNPS